MPTTSVHERSSSQTRSTWACGRRKMPGTRQTTRKTLFSLGCCCCGAHTICLSAGNKDGEHTPHHQQHPKRSTKSTRCCSCVQAFCGTLALCVEITTRNTPGGQPHAAKKPAATWRMKDADNRTCTFVCVRVPASQADSRFVTDKKLL